MPHQDITILMLTGARRVQSIQEKQFSRTLSCRFGFMLLVPLFLFFLFSLHIANTRHFSHAAFEFLHGKSRPDLAILVRLISVPR